MKPVAPGIHEDIPIKRNSGKLSILKNLLTTVRAQTQEKIVLVSNFTSTLDILQSLLQSINVTWCRLDGDTDPSKRQTIVDNFNRVDPQTCCIPYKLVRTDCSCVSVEFEKWWVWVESYWGVKVGVV